jgi:hypothetical protein
VPIGEKISHERDMEDHLGEVGYLSYEWVGAPSGVIDAYAGGTALIGLDEAIRYFNRRQAKSLSMTSYEIPVHTGEGSWIAVVIGILSIPATTFAATYAKKAAEKMAERDFAELGFKDIARKSMDALVHLINLLKRTGKPLDLSRTKIRWSKDATKAILVDQLGDEFEIPADYIKWFQELPRSTLKKIAAPIAANRFMKVASRQADGGMLEVTISSSELRLLEGDDDENEDEFLFPDLKHGDEVQLEGLITRGNQSTNSIGFQYMGHILNCIPETGNVRKYKSAMFLHCVIKATVNRHVGSLSRLDHRPTLIINQLIALESDNQSQQQLFE